MIFALLLSLCVFTEADDPANGWLGYALGKNPNGGNDPITFIEAWWTNLQEPTNKNCFYSPWFGIETSDNKNLLQPVNPWENREWSIYNEYFQWSPTHNQNSRSHVVYPGDLIYGSVTYQAASNSYNLYHADQTKGHEWSVNMTIGVQQERDGDYKTYNMIYVVFEKVCSQCDMYPPDDKVTFHNISVFWGGKLMEPKWTTAYVDNVCDNRAKVVDAQTIEITWNSKSDTDYTELYDMRERTGTNGNLKSKKERERSARKEKVREGSDSSSSQSGSSSINL